MRVRIMHEILVYAISVYAFTQVNAFKYESSILGEKLTYFVNNEISFTIKQQNDEKFAYLTFEKTITIANDLMLIVRVIREDGVEFQFPDNPSRLCHILEDQMVGKSKIMSRFNIPNVFNIIGRNCPIEKGTVRLTPHVFPHLFELKNDIGCGRFNLATSLLKCEPFTAFSKNCTLLIMAETKLEISASHCSNTFE
ncbi:uncharacterized protein LOC117169444 [Belonocnema kinseyi]|uniref:uncharacterized protein LOC117169444 n=1 Tax=Belonocnema kinseyi TaxID=2817044 RepID=UPI00143DC1A3|nr:uncharacterized protein LOC117169444 [Belonocnema kinseyi]